jgi:beta-hydroxylase
MVCRCGSFPPQCLLDILSLPYVNKGIWLEDMPPAAGEIKRLIRAATDADLHSVRSTSGRRRTSADPLAGATTGSNPEYRRRPRFDGPEIPPGDRALGFQQNIDSLHFGWVRVAAGALQHQRHHRRSASSSSATPPLLARQQALHLDDTLQPSANETDQLRYCMYVDITSPFPGFMAAVRGQVGWRSKINLISLTNWTLVQR